MNKKEILGMVVALVVIIMMSSCEKEDIIINNNIGCDQGCVDSLLALATPSSDPATALLAEYAKDGDDGWILSIIVNGEVLQNFLPSCGSFQEIEMYNFDNNTIEASIDWCSEYDLEMEIIDHETLEIELYENLSGMENVLYSLEDGEMKVSYVRTDEYITFVIANNTNPQFATMVLQFNN